MILELDFDAAAVKARIMGAFGSAMMRPALADVAEVFPQLVSQIWADPVAKGDGPHYYASSFAYSRGEFENQYTTLGFPSPGPSE